jgi:hypothetical protein
MRQLRELYGDWVWFVVKALEWLGEIGRSRIGIRRGFELF